MKPKFLKKQHFIVRACVLFSIAFFMSACGSTKLIEIDKSSKFLNLSEEQSEVIEPKIKKIEVAVDEYNLEKEALENELKELRGSRMGGGGSGGRGGFGRARGGLREEMEAFREKMEALRKTRAQYQGQIDTLVAEIKDVLDEEQLKKFEKIKLPELEMPEFGGRQRRGSRGRGGRGGRGGGRGGGDGFPPF